METDRLHLGAMLPQFMKFNICLSSGIGAVGYLQIYGKKASNPLPQFVPDKMNNFVKEKDQVQRVRFINSITNFLQRTSSGTYSQMEKVRKKAKFIRLRRQTHRSDSILGIDYFATQI